MCLFYVYYFLPIFDDLGYPLWHTWIYIIIHYIKKAWVNNMLIPYQKIYILCYSLSGKVGFISKHGNKYCILQHQSGTFSQNITKKNGHVLDTECCITWRPNLALHEIYRWEVIIVKGLWQSSKWWTLIATTVFVLVLVQATPSPSPRCHIHIVKFSCHDCEDGKKKKGVTISFPEWMVKNAYL